MSFLFWDASALGKRYTVETGSETVDALFAFQPAQIMGTTVWGYAETVSILLRKLNGGRLDLATFTTAVTAVQVEVIDNPDFVFLTIDDSAILAGISLMRRHNLNTADAAILAVVLRYVRTQSPSDQSCVLVTADRRLLRAANAEGLAAINPEVVGADEVEPLLTSAMASP